MKQEIIDFYATNNVPVEKMVSVGTYRHNLTPSSVRVAAESLYEDIQKGLEVRPIRLAWEVFARAGHMKAAAERAENVRIRELEDELAWYKQPWWKRIFRSKGDA